MAAVTRPRPLGLGARRRASARPPPYFLPARVPSRALAAPGLKAGLGPRRRCRLLPPAPARPRSQGPSRRLGRSAPAALPPAARALPARQPRAPVGPRAARRPASRCPRRDRRAAGPAAPVPLSLSLSAASFHFLSHLKWQGPFSAFPGAGGRGSGGKGALGRPGRRGRMEEVSRSLRRRGQILPRPWRCQPDFSRPLGRCTCAFQSRSFQFVAAHPSPHRQVFCRVPGLSVFFYQTEPDRLGFSERPGKGCVCSPRLREFQSQALQTDIFDPKQYYTLSVCKVYLHSCFLGAWNL